MANLVVVMFEKRTAAGKLVLNKLKLYGKPIVFNADVDDIQGFVSQRFGGDLNFETRKATKADLLWGVPSTKATHD